ncbi:bifunctional cytochrome P450/NADPH--P450 reductase [Sphingoaurantiacus capsulatus]|uniref:Bifunctional cytochrome P450/NADPH--P450 reductase n=1 Tax=Sphingoaurantiacus capsulatus TaxID=1771310 RepID=A0ABV7X9E1_9SPHN
MIDAPLANPPAPPGKLPLVGHLHQIPKGKLIQHLLAVARQHPGGIFKMTFGPRESLFIYSADLVAELSDETRFRKMPGPGLKQVRAFAGDGLFTAFTEEENWGKAHRILMPAFSQRAMRGYFDMILEVVDELVEKWSGPAGKGDIHVSDDMTRLTLDSIAIAGFDHRFHSFQKEQLDPFLEAMGSALGEAMQRLTRLRIQQRFAGKELKQFEADIAMMNDLVDGIIAERRKTPADTNDLLNLMLTAVDAETGEALDDVNIRYQVLTFLIAGHETTSGLLTFAFYLLLRHPHVLAQAYAEADRVLPGDTRPEYRHLAKMDVIERVLKEAQRLWPTAPAYSVAPYEDTIIGGRYALKKDVPVNVISPALHRDPAVWENPEEFDIDRWLPEAERGRNPHAYKPFGSGARACIGRQFAITEAKLAMAVILQKFAISDPHFYRLAIKETLTIKPDEFFMRIRPRSPHERLVVASSEPEDTPVDAVAVAGAGQVMTVLYGTSLGTSREVGETIAARAIGDGFEACAKPLDEGGAVPEDGVLVVVTATYNGRAPDSAVKLEAAIRDGRFTDLKRPGLRFAVLGVGNSQWPNYQAFPTLLDTMLEEAGAQRLIPRGAADVDGDFDGSVEAFLGKLWRALGAQLAPAEAAAPLEMRHVDSAAVRVTALPENAQAFTVTENRELVRPADGLWDFAQEAPRTSTRHVALQLPESATYAAGDHVAVYARNRPELVERAVSRLGERADAMVVLSASGGRFRHLPLGATVTVGQLLADFVDLQDPVPRRHLQRLAETVRCPHTRGQLGPLAGDAYEAEIGGKRVSLLDLLERFPAIELTAAEFVELSAPIQPRFYSIASSPLSVPGRVELLVGTLSAPAWSGVGHHQGFASTYMRDVAAGDQVLGFLRSPNPPFAPAADPSVPMILIGPGTGFAPFRGFLQERAAQKAAGQAVAPSLLFYGCRHPDHDWFYRDEMEHWAADAVAELHLAFSSVAEHPYRFVQDALWAEQEKVWAAIQAGAQIYVCGDGRFMAPAVRDALIRIKAQQDGTTYTHASDWLEALIEEGRYHQDVFGFGK